MARKEKNRQIAQDISKASFQAPSAGSGTNVPSLRTTPTNRMMESLSGFSAGIAKLAAVREKNDAAKEALKARNDALTGKFSVFDRDASVQVYDQTRGDIKGRSAAAAIQLDLTAAKADILNQNLTIQDSLEAYDEAKASIIQEKYGDHLKQTESYKSGFLPHVVSTIEKNRTDLASKHQAKFIAESKATQSEFSDTVIDSVPQTGTDKGVNFEQFSAIRTAGVNMGLEREEATINAIDSIGLRAVTEGKPWLLKFADEAGPNGFKVSNNTALNKKVIEFRTKAQAKFIQVEKLRIQNEARERAEGERTVLKQAYDMIIKNPTEDHSGMIKDIGTLGAVDGPKMAALSNFSANVRKGDRHIALDNRLVVSLKQQIAEGDITKMGQLVTIYNDSSKSGKGINLTAFNDLQSDLQASGSGGGSVNAYSTNLTSIKNIFGDDEFIEDNVSGYGKLKRGQAKAIQALSIRTMQQSLVFFKAVHGNDMDLNSPEARKFFTKVRTSLEANLANSGQLIEDQKELAELKIGFNEDGSIDQASVDRLKVDPGESDFIPFNEDPKNAVLPSNIQEALEIKENDGHMSLLETYNDARARNRKHLEGNEQFLKQIRDYANGN
jgi:hypothetical protein